MSARSAVVNNEFLAMTQGVDVGEKTIQVTVKEEVKVGALGSVTLTGIPATGTKARVEFGEKVVKDADPSALDAAATTLTAKENDVLTVYYKKEVTGEGFEFDAQKFSRKVSLELRTIAYDIVTGDVDCDIYFTFPDALPSSDISLSFEAGSVITPEVSYTILQPSDSTVMGQMVSVPRK